LTFERLLAGAAMLGYTRDELLRMPVSRIHAGELPQLQDFSWDDDRVFYHPFAHLPSADDR